jgi:hypothetical protein
VVRAATGVESRICGRGRYGGDDHEEPVNPLLMTARTSSSDTPRRLSISWLRSCGSSSSMVVAVSETEDYFEKTAASNFFIRVACSSSCV